MSSDLADFIAATSLCDTHEHLQYEDKYLGDDQPDILRNLFHNYVPADLVSAGASQEAVNALLDKRNPDIRARFKGVEAAWQAVQHTGYGEAVRTIAREFYGLDELTAAGIDAAQDKHDALVQPGARLHLLRDVAKLDHVQTDDFRRECWVDESGPDFFFYDISWAEFCNGQPNVAAITQETGVEIRDMTTLQNAMEAVFEQNAKVAIAVKSQHAYTRTLRWQERTAQEAARALGAYLHSPDEMSETDRLCLGDWCWARGVELATAYKLPFKLHTGYYAGHSRMPVDRIKSGHLCPLLARYPDARFVLMHIAWPYSEELISLAKHYPNVYADLCWAWSINPYSASDFVRRYLHAAPINKLFAFGGDTHMPVAAVAYARQARQWLTRALEAEVREGLLSEAQAIGVASRIMHDNQYACFDVEEKKAILQAASSL
ncbi:MAG: amidohydrolase family protein [Caldilineaceae bacterium]|nr:amidohydrolase family protein [Caldilineaceae bacterium]